MLLPEILDFFKVNRDVGWGGVREEVNFWPCCARTRGQRKESCNPKLLHRMRNLKTVDAAQFEIQQAWS